MTSSVAKRQSSQGWWGSFLGATSDLRLPVRGLKCLLPIAVFFVSGINSVTAEEVAVRSAPPYVEQTPEPGTQGPAITAVASSLASTLAESARFGTNVVGRSGHPLRWVRPNLPQHPPERAEGVSSSAEPAVFYLLTSEEDRNFGPLGREKGGPLHPLPEAKVGQEWKTESQRAGGVQPANFSSEADVFARPFGDQPQPLSRISDQFDRADVTLRSRAGAGGIGAGLGNGKEVASAADRLPAFSQEGVPGVLPPVFPKIEWQGVEASRKDSNAARGNLVFIREESPPKDSPAQDRATPEVPKPLADQLAAVPLVSPDICPEPAGPSRPLPQGLSPIGSLTHQIPSGDGKLPVLCPMSQEEHPAPISRGWAPVTFTWKASALCHKPAYFEQVQVERYGHSVGPLFQPIVSGAHFFLSVPLLPYKMGLYPPNECLYTLGHYRPGSCAPYMLDPLPLSLRAALFEAGAWTAAVFVIP